MLPRRTHAVSPGPGPADTSHTSWTALTPGFTVPTGQADSMRLPPTSYQPSPLADVIRVMSLANLPGAAIAGESSSAGLFALPSALVAGNPKKYGCGFWQPGHAESPPWMKALQAEAGRLQREKNLPNADLVQTGVFLENTRWFIDHDDVIGQLVCGVVPRASATKSSQSQ
mgnify:CR=1 FL=1